MVGRSPRLSELEMRLRAAAPSECRAVGLHRGDVNLLVSCRQVVEVIPYRRAERLPGDASVGVLFHRGRPLTVLDPLTWFQKLSAEQPVYWLLASLNGEPVGLAADRLDADVLLHPAVACNRGRHVGGFEAVPVGWNGRVAWCLQ